MRIVRTRVPARVGLLGNPSDAYGGKTLSLAIDDFAAEVVVYEWPEVEIVPGPSDGARFPSVGALVDDVAANGYYGGLRLVKAGIKRFADHCASTGVDLPEKGFSIRYSTSIPRSVGLGGSSAIVTGVVTSLAEFFEVEIDRAVLPSVILAAETEELGIAAGLQDRVAQVFGGLTYMDFSGGEGNELYESLDPALLPRLWLGYLPDAGEPSGAAHSAVRERWLEGDATVREAMESLARLAERGRGALEAGDHAALGPLMDENHELRASLFELDPRHAALVDAARTVGFHATYAGSGGAVVGPAASEAELTALAQALGEFGARIMEVGIARGATPK